MATSDVSASPHRSMAETWSTRFRRLWMMRRHPDPACVLDGLSLRHRRPVALLGEVSPADVGGMVLLLDHEHSGALEALLIIQRAHPLPFAAGSVVVGVENLPAEELDALDSYRRAARVPVFAVDLCRSGDRLLLQEALVATRVVVAMKRFARRDRQGRALHAGA